MVVQQNILWKSKICVKNKIFLLEDFSEALGSQIKNYKIGTFGDISISSIRSEKMIGVGEGGVVVSNNLNLFKKLERIASRNSPLEER